MPHSELSDTLSELVGCGMDQLDDFPIGPGVLYLLELPNRQLRYFSRTCSSFSPAFYKLLESTERWDELVVAQDRERYIQASTPENASCELRYRALVNRRNETLDVVDYRKVIQAPDGQPKAILGRLVDDSFRSVAFESLARRSWGEIATAMTRRYLHDFNNTIAGIYSLSELYAEPGSDPKSVCEAMGHIRDCAVRAQDITKRIRHLTLLEPGQASYYDLGELTKEQVPYMQALLPKGASIELDLPDGQFPVELDANLFRQSILHLTGNALDACGDEVALSLRLSESEDRATLEFSDNGPGFSPEALERACESFFTSKESSKHPGLGLSIVSDFAQRLDGSITLLNTDSGASIRLTLPLLARDPVPTTDKKPASPAIASQLVKEEPAQPSNPRLLIYTWEDITRHPLLIAMQNADWQLRVHLDPGQLLIDLAHLGKEIDGVLLFKSALDEKVEALVSELGHAKNCPPLGLIALGETAEAMPLAIKRNCGLIVSGSSKPKSLIAKLKAFYLP